jgi:hypothetical protein
MTSSDAAAIPSIFTYPVSVHGSASCASAISPDRDTTGDRQALTANTTCRIPDSGTVQRPMKSSWENRLAGPASSHAASERPVSGDSQVHEALAALVKVLARVAARTAQDHSTLDAKAGGSS